jgi:hypothetical protein
MLRIMTTFGLTMCLFACDAGTEGAATGSACAQSDLVAQCPPNTMPDLMADAASACESSTSVDLSSGATMSSGSGSITQGCVGTGSCRVVCTFESPCQYGVMSVSPIDGINCAGPPAGCGNSTCDDGENPNNCPIDCAGDCEPGATRCEGDALSTCTPSYQWGEATNCGSGQTCISGDNGNRCEDRDSTSPQDGTSGMGGSSPEGGTSGMGGNTGVGGEAGNSEEMACARSFGEWTAVCGMDSLTLLSEDDNQEYTIDSGADPEELCAVADIGNFVVCIADAVDNPREGAEGCVCAINECAQVDQCNP